MPRRAFVAAVLSALAAGGATALGLVGNLTQPELGRFQFSRGLVFAQGESARLRGFVTPALQDDRVMVVIVGHTGTVGDADANLALSEERAQAARQIVLGLGVDAEQINAAGVGGTAPLAKIDGESDRAHQARLARVDIALQVRR